MTLLRKRLRAAHTALLRILVRSLRRPVSQHYGFDRGTPVDRVFIDSFLEENAGDIRGRILEIKDARYASRFGGDRVERVDILDIDATNASATIVADLDEPGSVPEDTYDCIVLTQVLEFLRPGRALPNLYGGLRSGGVLLLTVPVLCRLETGAPDRFRVTALGLEELLREHCPADAELHVRQHGDVRAAVAFLLGLSAEETGIQMPWQDDPRYPVVTVARVRKP